MAFRPGLLCVVDRSRANCQRRYAFDCLGLGQRDEKFSRRADKPLLGISTVDGQLRAIGGGKSSALAERSPAALRRSMPKRHCGSLGQRYRLRIPSSASRRPTWRFPRMSMEDEFHIASFNRIKAFFGRLRVGFGSDEFRSVRIFRTAAAIFFSNAVASGDSFAFLSISDSLHRHGLAFLRCSDNASPMLGSLERSAHAIVIFSRNRIEFVVYDSERN